MKNDIVPPKLPRPVDQPQDTLPAPVSASEPAKTPPEPVPVPTESDSPEQTKKPFRPSVKLWVVFFLGIVLLAVVSAGIWYALALRPVNAGDTSRERIHIKPGSSLVTISDLLEEKRLIRSRLAFTLFARFSGAGAKLQAGTYSISPSESSVAIINHFTSGNVDQASLTFLPGATLRRLPGDTGSQRTDVESVLLNAGYEQEEIDAAFAKHYDHPLFAGKPSWADLEGYVYGETYKFGSDSSVEQILEGTFDEYYKAIEQNNLIEGFKAQGLDLYEGITLASIVQREVMSPGDQKQVAQVFLSRLKKEMTLGSDVTYQYAAKKAGIQPTPDLDSPYNTRKVTGLPPGPIAVPGLSALQAVAAPAPGDYLYFLSGDDGKTYFARTDEEHEANIVNHCQKNCSGF